MILRVGEDGVLQQDAGRLRGTCGAGGVDGEGATSVCMQNHSMTIGVDGDNGVTFADGRYLIRKVAPPLPGFDADGLALPSGDGPEVYEFDRLGRHLRTRDGLTGAGAADVRVRRGQAAGRRRRRVRQPHADRARRAPARRWRSSPRAASAPR